MVSRNYQDFTPSHKNPPGATCKRLGAVPADERFEVSAGDFKLVKEFASDHGLTVTGTEPAKRLIKLSGTAAEFQAAFQTQLSHYQDGQVTFRGRSGSLQLPTELHDILNRCSASTTDPRPNPVWSSVLPPKSPTRSDLTTWRGCTPIQLQ
jgi:hypothetical protein